MSIPQIIHDRLANLSTQCGATLRVVKHWENEFRPGLYCWFRGTVTDSRLLRIELAGTLAIELAPDQHDETDMFVFVNGVRLGPLASPNNYLWRRGSELFRWDDHDPGLGLAVIHDYKNPLSNRTCRDYFTGQLNACSSSCSCSCSALAVLVLVLEKANMTTDVRPNESTTPTSSIQNGKRAPLR